MSRLAVALTVLAVALASPVAAFASCAKSHAPSASWSNARVHLPLRASWSDRLKG
jgi:hypothetical protein